MLIMQIKIIYHSLVTQFLSAAKKKLFYKDKIKKYLCINKSFMLFLSLTSLNYFNELEKYIFPIKSTFGALKTFFLTSLLISYHISSFNHKSPSGQIYGDFKCQKFQF